MSDEAEIARLRAALRKAEADGERMLVAIRLALFTTPEPPELVEVVRAGSREVIGGS